MTKILKQNSYYILGLDTSASQRDILKRSKEIINRLKIDDLPIYDLDLDVFEDFRTEESVKKAVQKLSAPRKRLKEYFFWFQIADSVDDQAVGLLKNNDYTEANRVWEHNSEKDTTKSLLYKKNIAILRCLLLFTKDNKSDLSQSLKLWKELIDSDKFWSAFTKVYKLHDEFGTSQEVIDEFKSNVASYVADIYTELSQLHNDNKYIAESSKILEVKGSSTEKTILNPIYQSVIEITDQLESLKVSEDGKFDEQETQTIKKLVKKAQEEFSKLIDLGLYEDSQSKVVRDKMADAIRIVVLDLHNNLNETDKAIELMNVALDIVGTVPFKTKIENDMSILKEVKKNAKIIKPMEDMIEAEKFEEALELIESERKKHKENDELQIFYDTQKKLCITMLALDKYKQAQESFKLRQSDNAKRLFKESRGLIYKNIDLFSFNKDVIHEIVSEIKDRTTKANVHDLSEFDDYRKSYVDLAKEKFEGHMEYTAFIILIDGYIYGGLTDVVETRDTQSGLSNILYWVGFILLFWVWWLGALILVGTWLYSRSSK